MTLEEAIEVRRATCIQERDQILLEIEARFEMPDNHKFLSDFILDRARKLARVEARLNEHSLIRIVRDRKEVQDER